jgi:hypothetical protein
MYMTRESTITNMCYTYRHDYGLIKSETGGIMSGMTQDERTSLWNTMAQIFDNDIAPYMEFKHVATARNTCGNE